MKNYEYEYDPVWPYDPSKSDLQLIAEYAQKILATEPGMTLEKAAIAAARDCCHGDCGYITPADLMRVISSSEETV